MKLRVCKEKSSQSKKNQKNTKKGPKKTAIEQEVK